MLESQRIVQNFKTDGFNSRIISQALGVRRAVVVGIYNGIGCSRYMVERLRLLRDSLTRVPANRRY